MGLAVGAGAEFTVRSGPEHARRRQVPLGLGYALSIHRCQGMTLDRVELDLRSAFECGQVRERPVLRHLPSRAIFCPASSSVLRHLLACHLHSCHLFLSLHLWRLSDQCRLCFAGVRGAVPLPLPTAYPRAGLRPGESQGASRGATVRGRAGQHRAEGGGGGGGCGLKMKRRLYR